MSKPSPKAAKIAGSILPIVVFGLLGYTWYIYIFRICGILVYIYRFAQEFLFFD
jgi:hypothetical protein